MEYSEVRDKKKEARQKRKKPDKKENVLYDLEYMKLPHKREKQSMILEVSILVIFGEEGLEMSLVEA